MSLRSSRSPIDFAMPRPEPLSRLDWARIDTLVFAGGGNRCWWQAGVIEHLRQTGRPLPAHLVGTSAGAAVAASCMTDDGPAAALASCLRLYAENEGVFDWSGLRRLKLHFAHRHTYPAWIGSFVHEGNFARLRAHGSRLRVGLTRPSRLLGVAGSVAVGSLAYLVDKYLRRSLHPALPAWLGLRQDFVDLHRCATVAEAQTLLSAAAAVPPFMPVQRVGAALAIDGGYIDSAPLPPQSAAEKSNTLVLLTRHHPGLPACFRWGGRSYWQPSRRVPVSTWDCTARASVREAFSLGLRDALCRFPRSPAGASMPRAAAL